jgi:hypothetical protein
MSDVMNPAAPHFLPSFITGPGETDYLLTGAAVFLVLLVMFMGSMYFWLHSIPERLSHGSSKIQFQLVAVLSLLALFTHINAFWVAALLLALVPIPDFWTPLAAMADSLAKMAGLRWRDEMAGPSHDPHGESTAVIVSPTPAAVVSLNPRATTGVAPAHAGSGGVTAAAPTQGGIGGPPPSGNEESALEAKAAGSRRRTLTTEGA